MRRPSDSRDRIASIILKSDSHLIDGAGFPVAYKVLAEHKGMICAVMCAKGTVIIEPASFMPLARCHVVYPGMIRIRKAQHIKGMALILVGIANRVIPYCIALHGKLYRMI